MKIVYAVITQTDPASYYNVVLEKRLKNKYDSSQWYETDDQVAEGAKTMTVNLRPFVLGEILLLEENEYGRELVGDQRKPSKWFDQYECFDTVEEAIKRSWEVLGIERQL